jgi:hypothetical protein
MRVFLYKKKDKNTIIFTKMRYSLVQMNWRNPIPIKREKKRVRKMDGIYVVLIYHEF